jgi:hypothetical protein
MKLVISTQVYENYGAHDWDGTGECPQYWKAKGGSDYVIKRFKGGDEQAVKQSFAYALRSRAMTSSIVSIS